MGDPMVLVVSTMFPNRALPVHAVFVQQRIQALSRYVALEVCSPVPWFPLVDKVFDKYRHRPLVPVQEDQQGLQCHFPRFTSIPMVAKHLDGPAVLRCLRAFVDRHQLRDRIQLIDAHLAFPDGWAALQLARELDVPLTVTLRGHDINELGMTQRRREMVVEALSGADRYFGVAKALCDGAVELGAPADRAVTSSNGVDPERFRPVDRVQVREALGLPVDRRIVLSVGHLVRRKGFHHILQALAALRAEGDSDTMVVLVGAPGEEGNFLAELEGVVREHDLKDHVHFAGAVANPELYRWYSAADVFCLASEKEGWPNVVLEAMACGIPVVATNVWGTPEIICREDLGLLTPYGDVPQLAQSLRTALDREWDADGLRAYALENTWDDTAQGLVRVMESVMAERGRELPRARRPVSA